MGTAPEALALRYTIERRADDSLALRVRSVQGVRAGSAAARAGLRDGLTIRGASVYRGDPTRPIELRVMDDGTERRVSWLPASDETVAVQELAIARAGCLAALR